MSRDLAIPSRFERNSITSWQYFRGSCQKSLPANSWHSKECKFGPSSRQNLFLFIWKGIPSLLSQRERNSISVQSHKYIDDVLSRFCKISGPAELEIKDTTESIISASYLDFLLSTGRNGQLHTSIYYKGDDFNFYITNFPFPSRNIPSSPAYGVFFTQLIWYARACSSFNCFILKVRRLSSKLLE